MWYTLDKLSLGLHKHSNDQLIETLKRVHDLGSSVGVGEYNVIMIKVVEYIVDIARALTNHGGIVVAQSILQQISDSIAASIRQYYIAWSRLWYYDSVMYEM
ncbi:hypothetical protein [Candidatus Vallotiella sp. (ex Adelges kitamiensis)]|uniref:hypothetical protein n=1 Tax=Candidatus Vallotiella sp. (ex Adelges kitamiensis) TaxID=2864217 RepID=UPI001CE33FA9|nr:hypothetical protein [Candidatus Vallotia sp. (ex Adelges kitamiensis)]